MGKGKKIGLGIVLGLVALIIVLLAGVKYVANTRYLKDQVNKILSSSIDGRINYDKLDISFLKSFPTLRITLDTVSLTYDHDKFAQWDGYGTTDPLLNAGRGEIEDTLARFDRFTAAVNVWQIIRGRMRLRDAHISNLGAYAHFYDSTASNLDIFHSSPDSLKEDSGPFSTPMISVGDVWIGDVKAVYTDQESAIFGDALMDRLGVSGMVKFEKDGSIDLRKLKLDIDSLLVSGRIPSYSVDAALNRLSLSQASKKAFDLGIDMDAFASTEEYGDFTVPVKLDGRVALDLPDGNADIQVDRLDGRVAYIPLHLEGGARLFPDSTAVKASLAITDCPLDTLLNEYAVKFTDYAKKVNTNAKLSLQADADGIFAEGVLPAIDAAIQIPKSHLAYSPLGVDGSIELDASGSMSRKQVIDASIKTLEAFLPGISLSAHGDGRDITGADPSFEAYADLDASFDSVSAFLPQSLGISGSGNLSLDAETKGRLSYFKNLKFKDGFCRATLRGDKVTVCMPSDTIDVRLDNPSVKASIDKDGMDAAVLADAARFSMGNGLEARSRKMENYAKMCMVEYRGQNVPFLDVDHVSRTLSLRMDNNWFRLMDIDICATARQNPDPSVMRRQMAQNVEHRGPSRRPSGSHARQRVDDPYALDISLDTSITKYLRKWTPNLTAHVGRGSAAMPMLPLRTSISGVQVNYDGDKLQIDSLSARMGTSRIAARGWVSGLRRALMRKGNIKSDLYFHSRRVNVNELLAAFTSAKETNVADSVFAEGDESFVVDSLDNVELDKSGIPLLMVPSNVDATVKILVDKVDYSDYVVEPFEATLNMRDRKLQLMDTKVNTSLGNIALDAFYATPAKEDISAGVDLGVYEVSADSLIRLLPSVDNLMPALKSFKGKLNCEASALTQLDTNMNVIIPSVEGVLRINGKDLNVDDAGGLKKITRLLLFRNPNIGHIDDLDVNAVIHDSKVDVFPFQLGVDRYRIALNGMQGLDKTMYYHASILKSPFLIRFGINVFGSFDKWSFNIGLPKYKNGNVPVYTKQIDTMQINIANTIKEVFESEVSEITSRDFSREVDRMKRETGYEEASDVTVDPENPMSADELAFQVDAMLEEEELYAEVDAILEESFRDIEQVMGDYEAEVYDKRILRKMDRLAEKQKKQIAKKNDD